jgi:hypothetical protein
MVCISNTVISSSVLVLKNGYQQMKLLLYNFYVVPSNSINVIIITTH